MNTTSPMSSARQQFDPARAILWASAFVLASLVILQAGKLPGNPAYAGQVSSAGAYTILTADSGRGDDANPDEILVVIDNRTEALMVYETDGRSGIVPRDGGNLANLFRQALNR